MTAIFLNNRLQYFDSDRIYKDHEEIGSNTPHGSILRLVFVIYINNLDACSDESGITFFADDTAPKDARNIKYFSIQKDSDSVSSC